MGVGSRGDNRTISLNSHGLCTTCRDLGNACPAVDHAPLVVVAYGNHRMVSLKPNRVSVAGRQLDDAFPVIHIALVVVVVPHGDHRAVCPKSQCVSHACGDLGDALKVSCDRIVAAHSDSGCDRVNIGNGAEITSPAGKLVFPFSLGN